MNTFFCENKCCKYHVTNYVPRRPPVYTVVDRKARRRKAGVFVYDPAKNKVLLVQSRGRLWGPPKGSAEPLETFEECGRRELQEETGLTVSEEVFQRPYILKSNVTYFAAAISEGDCEIQMGSGNDANGIGWFDVDCVKKSVEEGKMKINQHLRMVFRTFLNIILSK